MVKCVLQDCREGVGHRPLDEADIVRDAGDDLARGRFVEEGERLGLEAPEDEVPYIGDDLLAHEAHKIRLEVIENALREVEERDAEGDQHQQCGVLLEEDLVHDGLDEVGGKPVRRRDEGHEYHGEEKLHPVRLDEFEESQVKCHVFILSGGGLLRPRRSMGRGPERRDDFAGLSISFRRPYVSLFIIESTVLAIPSASEDWMNSGYTSCPAITLGRLICLTRMTIRAIR